MCDTEINFEKSDYSQRDNTLVEEQRNASLYYLAFWSHPAWFPATKHSSLSTAAIREWVTYHRLSVALKKETVAEIIAGVNDVIPNSKLSNYGNYNYDIDHEDICCVAEDVNARSHFPKTDKSAFARRYDVWASETETDISDKRDSGRLPMRNQNNFNDLRRKIRSLSEWLKELNQVLINVRQIANEAQLLDSWTETLLKFCLRFVCILRHNENLVKLLNSEISFIIDYEQLRKMSISKIELQSIPQPENKGDIFLDNKSIEALWLKLSSSKISQIWKNDTKLPFPFNDESQRSKHQFPLIKINFLRCCRSKNFDSLRHTIHIPKNMESELLGSLLQVMQSSDISIKVDDASESCFPEAHGEWTKRLFPHRLKLKPIIDKDSTLPKSWTAVSTPQASNSLGKLEHGFSSETAALPMQFYKSIPPPTIAPYFQPHFMPCQPRNRNVFLSPNILISNPSNQQMKFKVPSSVPVSSIQPTAYISQSTLHQSCNVPQRLSTSVHASIARKYRMNILRVPYQHCIPQDITESQKHQSKPDKNSCLEKIQTENETKGLNEEKYVFNNAEARILPNISKTTTMPYIQLNHGYNFPLQNIGNANTASQSIISNPQLQAHKSRPPLNMNYPITSYRLRTPLIKNVHSPRNNYILPQFTTKPRFLGPITVNNIKQIQERLFQQRCYPLHQDVKKIASFEDIQLHLKDTNLSYEDKVEKWLESVKKYVKSGSLINLEEMPDLPNIELCDNCSQLDDVEKDDSTELGKWQNENTSDGHEVKSTSDEIKSFFNISTSTNNRNLHENKANNLKCKKMKAKKLFLEHLHLFRRIIENLKKCKSPKRKTKIVKKYLAGIYSTNTKEFHLENLIKIIRKKSFCIKNVGQPKEKKEFLTKSNYDMLQSNLLINDICKNKIFIHESQEFNTFPSKHMKLSNTKISFFETETLIQDKHNQWISSLNYFDSVVDELFFAVNGIEGIPDVYQNEMMQAEINGWSHFKLTIKTVMKNIISSLDAHNL